MAEKLILPNSIWLYIAEEGGDQAAIVCLTQNDLNGTSNNSTIDTFCGTEQLPGSQSQSISGAFRRIWTPDTGRVSEKFLYNAWKDKTHLEFTMQPVSPVQDDIIYSGTGYITQYNNVNGTNAIPTGTMTITVDTPMELSEFEES